MSTMPLPFGAWMARTTTVPGDSLNGLSSEPLAPRPGATTLRPTAETCGGAAGGAGAGVAAGCLPRAPRPCARAGVANTARLAIITVPRTRTDDLLVMTLL